MVRERGPYTLVRQVGSAPADLLCHAEVAAWSASADPTPLVQELGIEKVPSRAGGFKGYLR